MLKGIPASIGSELMNALMQMGHGDDLLICDVNHPAASIARHTVWGQVIDLYQCSMIMTHGVGPETGVRVGALRRAQPKLRSR